MNLASRGLRDMGEGEAPIEDEAETSALQLRARGILIKSFLLAAVLSAAVFFWPTH